MRDSASRPAKTGNFVTRRILAETVIVPVRGGVGNLDAIFTLNEVGGRIWELLDGRRSVRQIADALRREYDVSSEEAERDLLEFLASLGSAGLIEDLSDPAD